MTETSTTISDPLDIPRGSLVLVTLTPEYARSWQGPRVLRERDSSDEERTFYATPHNDASDYVTLVVPESDQRSQDMWPIRRPGDYGLTLDTPHRGWDVLKTYVSPVVVDEAPRPLQVGDRVTIAHPEATAWNGPGEVTEVRHPDTLLIVRAESGQFAGQTGGFHPDHLTRAEEASQEAASGPETAEGAAVETFTREDVDRLVREAREAARAEAERRFEEWKDRASDIACQYADDNNLCGEFERCMEELGLRGRNREYEVTIVIGVEARNEDHARDAAVERVYDMGHSEIRYAIQDVEEA